MSCTRWAWALVLLAMASPPIDARPDGKGSPMQTIRDKGLEIVRGRLVLPDETKTVQAVEQARDALADFQEAWAICSAILNAEFQWKVLGNERAATEIAIRDAQISFDQINSNRGYRGSLDSANNGDLKVAVLRINALKSDLVRIDAAILQLKGMLVSPQERDRVVGTFQIHQSRLTSAASDLKDALEPVEARYRALSVDPELKKAIDALKAARQGTLKLRSQEFEAAVKDLGALRKAMGIRLPKK